MRIQNRLISLIMLLNDNATRSPQLPYFHLVLICYLLFFISIVLYIYCSLYLLFFISIVLHIYCSFCLLFFISIVLYIYSCERFGGYKTKKRIPLPLYCSLYLLFFFPNRCAIKPGPEHGSFDWSGKKKRFIWKCRTNMIAWWPNATITIFWWPTIEIRGPNTLLSHMSYATENAF